MSADGRETTVVVAGLGYFSQFHLAAWQANADTRIAGVCDIDAPRLAEIGSSLGDSLHVDHDTDLASLVARVQPDIVDIIAPPPAHDQLVRASLSAGRTIICQKPFCQSMDEAEALIAAADAAGCRIVIHENFRFQPWYRTIKSFLDAGRLGRVFQARFALRPGDGRGPDAYLSRQPAFQTMPRLLIHETGVHFIDLFRWLFGDILSVYADLRRLNPAITGEDAGLMILTHASGAQSVFDGNRLSDHTATDPRRTMGELEIEGEAGVLSLNGNGRIAFRRFGESAAEPVPLTTTPDPDSFGGGCVAALIDHVVRAHRGDGEFENLAGDYLTVIAACDAAYLSATEARRIDLK